MTSRLFPDLATIEFVLRDEAKPQDGQKAMVKFLRGRDEAFLIDPERRLPFPDL